MKNKIIKTTLLCVLTIFGFSCEDKIEELGSSSSSLIESIVNVKIVDGTAHIYNNASLVQMM